MFVRGFVLAVGTWSIIAACCSAIEPANGKRNDAASEKLGIKLSLQCWTFKDLSLFETADEASRLGVKYLELFPGQKLKPGSDLKISLPMSDEMQADIKKKFAEVGVRKAVAFGVDTIPADEKAARKYFESAKKLGIEVLVTETWPTAMHDQLCKEFQMRMALHNHPKTWPPSQVLSACKDLSKQIGSCADTGHWMRDGYVPAETLKALEGRVLHSHFKDRDKFGDGHDVPYGTGVGNSKAMLAELKRQGFKGYLSIEYEHGTPKDLAINLPKCVQFFDATMEGLAK